MNRDPGRLIPDAVRQLASLPLAVILVEPGQYIASVNPAAEQFLGQSARRLVGKPLVDALRFGEPRLMERFGDSETPVSARDLDVTIAGSWGGVRRVDLTLSPVADMPGWQLLAIQDNSAIEALGEDSGGSEFAALRGPEILAHEIKNPLAGIRGAAQLLSRRAADKDKALTELITSEVDRIATLIEQMQQLSGRTVAPVEPCNLHQIAHRATAVLEAADEYSGNAVRIEEEYDPSLPPVLGNPAGLVQVLINLLSNAREACESMPEPKVVIGTRFASGLQVLMSDSGTPVRLPVELRVSDNGPGVDAALRDHIFEPFVTSKKSGQGLGLPLVRKLVRDMNGRIAHERDDDKGWTHFRIHLPLANETSARNRKRKSAT